MASLRFDSVARRAATVVTTRRHLAVVVLAGVCTTPTLARNIRATCATCHLQESTQFATSVHHEALRCQQCHGGRVEYELTGDQAGAIDLGGQAKGPDTTRQNAFDHGASFTGRPRRVDIPKLCGTCHAEVERMNPYGLRTDQLEAYWTSVHGKRLKQAGDDRVAVCVDCHGTHDILPKDDARSRTYFRNIPSTCARCHENEALMSEFGLSSKIVEQYRQSVHGRNLLEHGDSGSPSCATCHGSHGATPPGFADVGHVCGRCHQQIEEYFATGIHGRIPGRVGCVGCHGGGGDVRNHHIEEASPTADQLVEVYARVHETVDDPQQLRSRFTDQVDQIGGSLRPDRVCLYCHGQTRPEGGHQVFFTQVNSLAIGRGKLLTTALRNAQFDYAATSERTARMGRGVVSVESEALRAEDAKTELMALYAFMHTIDADEVQARAQKVNDICTEVNASLDEKQTGLTWRRVSLVPIWGLIVIFAALMYRKYRLLHRAYVAEPGQAISDDARAALTRRRALNFILTVLGVVTGVGLVWPVVAFILPVRRRGGAKQRSKAGNESDWEPWTVRKVVVSGKPVAVIRTDKEFRAFSAICTHLGCIVHWHQAKREFICPCHAATFDAEGEVVAGPPPKGLLKYTASVVQGEVLVSEAT